jgi:hypothetical protein
MGTTQERSALDTRGSDPDAGVEQVPDSRFDWVTGVNTGTHYYSQYWFQREYDGNPRPTYCVIKRHDNGLYYVSDTEDSEGVNDEGPFDSLTDAAAVCVMRNYGNET